MTEGKPLDFPSSVRVRSRRHYLRIQKTGDTVRGRFLIILSARNDTTVARFGITVSKKSRNAVERNSIRRKIREIQRLNRSLINPGYDIVVIARQTASKASFKQLEADYLSLALRAGLMKEELE